MLNHALHGLAPRNPEQCTLDWADGWDIDDAVRAGIPSLGPAPHRPCVRAAPVPFQPERIAGYCSAL